MQPWPPLYISWMGQTKPGLAGDSSGITASCHTWLDRGLIQGNQSQPGSPTCSLILFTRNGLDLQGYEENAFIRKSLEQKVKMDSLNPFGQGEEGVRISGVMNSGWHGAQPSNFQLV